MRIFVKDLPPLTMVTKHLKVELVSTFDSEGHTFNPLGVSYKNADNIWHFLKAPLTYLDRRLAFFTKFPRDHRSSQTICTKAFLRILGKTLKIFKSEASNRGHYT